MSAPVGVNKYLWRIFGVVIALLVLHFLVFLAGIAWKYFDFFFYAGYRL